MKSIHQILRERVTPNWGTDDKQSLVDLEQSQWSKPFESLMRSRLIMGALRYGKLNAPGKPQFDRIGNAIDRLKQYQQTGNDELLVDVSNLALIEFVEGKHPKKHFKAADDSSNHAKQI